MAKPKKYLSGMDAIRQAQSKKTPASSTATHYGDGRKKAIVDQPMIIPTDSTGKVYRNG